MRDLFELPQPQPMPDGLSTRDDVCRMANELELETHLAGMSARERWRVLGPRVAAIVRALAHSDRLSSDALLEELAVLRTLLEVPRGEAD